MGQKFRPERLFSEDTKNFGKIRTTQALVNSHLWGYFKSLTSPVQLRGGCYRISLSQQIPILKRLYLVWEIPWQWRFVTNCQKKKYGFGCYGNGGHIGFWWHKWEALSHLIYQQIQFILGIQTDKTTTKLLVRGIFYICFSFCFMTLSIWAIAK